MVSVGSRDVNGVLSSSSISVQVPQTRKSKQPSLAAAEEEEEEALPKQDQSEAVVATHGPKISPQVPDGDKQDSIEDEFDLLSLEHKAAEELYKLPKFGESYEAVTVDVKRIEKRLKYLSMNFDPRQASPTRMISQGREIADSVSLLMIKRSSSKVIEMAGLKAQRAVSLTLQAEMMVAKAIELLYQSQEMLQAARFVIRSINFLHKGPCIFWKSKEVPHFFTTLMDEMCQNQIIKLV